MICQGATICTNLLRRDDATRQHRSDLTRLLASAALCTRACLLLSGPKPSSVPAHSSRVPWELTYTPSKNLRISLSFTRQDWRISAADRDVRSMSVPVMTSSSFVPALFSTFTPGNILTMRTRFSPKKFRNSTVPPLLVIVALIGKCAYTKRILYSYFFCTPSNKLLMWLQTLRSIESCFDLAKYIFARTSCPLFAK